MLMSTTITGDEPSDGPARPSALRDHQGWTTRGSDHLATACLCLLLFAPALHLVFCPPEVGLTQASLAGALWVLASGLMACGPWALASGFWLEGSLAYGFYAHGLWALVCDLCLRDLFSVRPGDDVVFRPSPQDTLTTQKVREIHLQPKYADAFEIVPDLSDTKRTRRG